MAENGKNSCVVFVHFSPYWSYPYLNFLRFFRAKKKKKNAFQAKKIKSFRKHQLHFSYLPSHTKDTKIKNNIEAKRNN